MLVIVFMLLHIVSLEFINSYKFNSIQFNSVDTVKAAQAEIKRKENKQ